MGDGWHHAARETRLSFYGTWQQDQSFVRSSLESPLLRSILGRQQMAGIRLYEHYQAMGRCNGISSSDTKAYGLLLERFHLERSILARW